MDSYAADAQADPELANGEIMSSVPIEELLNLSLAERIELVEDLWESIVADPEGLALTDAQKAELDRRLKEHRDDPGSAVPWEVVRERLYKKYG